MASFVTVVISPPFDVWSSTRDMKFGVDVSPLFHSIVLLDNVTTSPFTFLICGWEIVFYVS